MTVVAGPVESAATAVLVASSVAARRRRITRPEARVFRLINELPDRLHLPVWAVMQGGSLAAVFVVSAVLGRLGRPGRAVAALVGGVTVWVGVKALKPLIGRGRPARHVDRVSVRGRPQSGLGYPSGHAAVATTLAVVGVGGLGRWRRFLAGAVAVTIGWARVYVGAHLPLDVVGGSAIGILGGRAALRHLAHGGER